MTVYQSFLDVPLDTNIGIKYLLDVSGKFFGRCNGRSVECHLNPGDGLKRYLPKHIDRNLYLIPLHKMIFFNGETLQFSLDLWVVHLVGVEAEVRFLPSPADTAAFLCCQSERCAVFLCLWCCLRFAAFCLLCNYSSGSIFLATCRSFFASVMP